MRKALFLIAILGLLVSGYLSVTYILGGPIRCGIHGGCEVVRDSPYAALFGIPTPLYGVVYYLLVAAGALLLASARQRQIEQLLLGLTTVGVAVSAWLTYLEAFVINAWCRWCVVSAALTVLAWLVVLWSLYFKSSRKADTVSEAGTKPSIPRPS